jgi:hypothetical protein
VRERERRREEYPLQLDGRKKWKGRRVAWSARTVRGVNEKKEYGQSSPIGHLVGTSIASGSLS